MDKIEALNQSWFLMINAASTTPTWLIWLATVIAQVIVYLVLLLLFGLWWLGGRATREQVIKAACVVVLTLAIGQYIRLGWPHPRPFMLGLGNDWLYHEPNASFPSHHMGFLMGIAIPLLLSPLRAWGGGIFAAGLAVAWARVFLGVHFPLDMVGALMVAILSYIGVTAVWCPLYRRLERLSEAMWRVLQRMRAG